MLSACGSDSFKILLFSSTSVSQSSCLNQVCDVLDLVANSE